MASTYSPALRLELMATGDQSGTWGDTTNTNLGTLLEQAITGYLSVAQGDVANLTLTTVNGGSDQARNAIINITGALTANRNVVVQTANKLYLVTNSTTGGFNLTFKTASGTGVVVVPGASRLIYSDGTNVVDGQLGPLLPSSNDGGALGASGTAWSDLFLASGAIVNFNAGNVTITHSAGNLDISSAAAGSLLTLTSTDAGATSGPNLELYRNSATPAANDVLAVLYWYGKDSAANKQEYASTQVTIVDATSTSEDAVSEDYVTVGGARTAFLRRGALASGTANPNAVGLPLGQLSFPATQNPSSDVNTLDDYEETSTTPTVTANTGTFTTVNCALRCTKIGRLVTFVGRVDITNAGTAGGTMHVPLPFTATADGSGAGSDQGITGMQCWVYVASGSAVADIAKYDGLTIIGTGRVIVFAGSFIA